jgi:hypothetical protein
MPTAATGSYERSSDCSAGWLLGAKNPELTFLAASHLISDDDRQQPDAGFNCRAR